MAGYTPRPHNYVFKEQRGLTQVLCKCGDRSEFLEWPGAIAWANEHTAQANPEWSERGRLASKVVVQQNEVAVEAALRSVPDKLAGEEGTRVPGEERQGSPLWGVREEGESTTTVRS